ncbi:DUF3179 domain-containing protein [Cellulophaga sp. Asnod2-G02]|uniref:DUF3179 domain-containing protein n=1 Tax=Cellulophaga sp. Asnod2-G02 TaxID=3160572 RepID=UPI0038693ED8
MRNLIAIIGFMLLQACSSSSSSEEVELEGDSPANNNPTSSVVYNWSIPISEVFDGGPGKDGIPALVNPEFDNIQNITYLADDDLVIGIKSGDDVRAYPHAILDWHEIINDNLEDVSVALTYCPLTGTGIGWSRMIEGEETTFGVSGLLYNTNLIPYDRATGSNWSQILNESVYGELQGEKPDLIRLFETDWKTWKILYPNSRVVSINTGFSRTYGTSPYGNYNTNDDIFLFPVSVDSRLPSKERVHAILNGEDAKVYRFSDFGSGNIIRDTFKDKEYLIVGNSNFILSFELTGEQRMLDFEYIYDGSEIIISDKEGCEWNIFGEAISGSRTRQVLGNSNSLMGMWFSIPAFYNTELY